MPAVQFCIRGLFVSSSPSPAALGRPECLRPFLPQRITRNIRSSYGSTRQTAWSRRKTGGRRSLSRISLSLSRFLQFYFLLRQEPPIGQSEHPHPQDEPFFFFFTILTVTAITTARSTAQIIIVAMFSLSQANIYFVPRLTSDVIISY